MAHRMRPRQQQASANVSAIASRVRDAKPSTPVSPLSLKANFQWLLVLVLLAAALISLSTAVNEAVHRSIDFEWSGARLIVNHQDPYKTFLEGDPRHQIILSQQPVYPSELFTLYLPFGLMPFSKAAIAWAAINTCLAILCVCMTSLSFNLNIESSIILLLIFLSSTPLRVAIANGQQSLLTLCFVSLCFYCSSLYWQGTWLGLSYSKYSFAPVMVAYWLATKRYTVLLWSMIPPLLGLFVVRHFVDTSFINLALDPIRVSEVVLVASEGFGDYLSLADTTLHRLGYWNAPWQYLPQIFALLAAFVGARTLLKYGKRLPESLRLAILIVLTLNLFKHLIYDFVFLLFPAAAIAQAPNQRSRAISMIIIAWFWFGSSLVSRVVVWPSIPVMTLNCIALSVLAGTCAFAYSKKEFDRPPPGRYWVLER